MPESVITAEDKMKLKKILAFSRDFTITLLDNTLLPELIKDQNLVKIFEHYSDELIRRIKLDVQKTLAAIDDGENAEKLRNEGLTGMELSFKYDFLNSILTTASITIINHDFHLVNFRSLDEYDNDYIQNGTSNPILGYHIFKKIPKLFHYSWVKKYMVELIRILLGIVNKCLNSINAVIPQLGAFKEIKDFLESGMDVGKLLS